MSGRIRIAGFDVIDLIGGLAVGGGGLAVIVGATTYPIGTIDRMGPGYMPIITGVILVLIGAGLIIGSRMVSNELPPIRLTPVAAIFSGLLWWALTVEWLGLVPSTIGLVVLTSLAQERPKLIMIAATAGFLVVFSLVVFVYALKIPIPAVIF